MESSRGPPRVKNKAAAPVQISARFAAPVFPGDLLDLHVWREEGAVGFRVTNDAGREVVSCGYAVFRKGHGA
jgi:acyl dehydratase